MRAVHPALTTIVIASVAAMPSNVMPVLSQLLSDFHGLDEAQLGYFVASGTLAGLIASASAPYWITRVDIRYVVGACLAIYAVGLLGLGYAPSLVSLFCIQFVLGGAAIVVASACITILARQKNPARILSFKISADVILASGFLYLLPIATFGLRGFVAALSAFFVAAILLAVRLPASTQGGATPTTRAGSLRDAPLSAWLALATMVIFSIAGVSVWIFLGRLALHAGLDAKQSATAIAAGLFVGIVGALAAASLAGRTHRIWPQTVSGMLFVISIPALAYAADIATFLVAVFVFNIAWNFFIPFVMGLLATRDASGRLPTLIPATGMLGGVLGPPLAGNLMRATSYESAMLAMACIAAIAIAMYARLARRND